MTIPEDQLVLTWIEFCCIDEIDTIFVERHIQLVDSLLLRILFTECHGAHAYFANLQVGLSEFHIVHSVL